jgi:tRNA G10  N-methylase Trm11
VSSSPAVIGDRYGDDLKATEAVAARARMGRRTPRLEINPPLDLGYLDSRIAKCISERALVDNEYWDFRAATKRSDGRPYFQYPAMMVPRMQGALIDAFIESGLTQPRVLDTFAGSGTILIEAMKRGLDFYGLDVNPLAVLLCRVKKGPFLVDCIEDEASLLINRLRRANGTISAVEFPNATKWFSETAVARLSRIHRAIRRLDNRAVRRFLWLALAETVRLSSNSRTSTFKLHLRPGLELKKDTRDAQQIFEKVLTRNIDLLREHRDELRERGHLSNGHYKGTIDIRVADAVAESPFPPGFFDLVITSPPYGDNTSTVPYGQHSYLPLQWIPFADIGSDADPGCLATTQEIDRRSLGGYSDGAVAADTIVSEMSSAYRETINRLASQRFDRALRVAAFTRDLHQSLKSISRSLRPNGYLALTLGNRNVGGLPVPLDRIVEELLISLDFVPVASLSRRIPQKRMASRNSRGETMRSERVLVMRKAGSA